MKDMHIKPFKISITLKNKLLLAFLFVGIIPSLSIGFLLYKKSDESLKKLIYTNMYEKIQLLEKNNIITRKHVSNEGITLSVPKGETVKDEDLLRYIDELNRKPYYDATKRIKIAEVDDVICGAMGGDDGSTIYHFSYINKTHPWIDDIGTIFVKISLIIITLSIGFSLGLSYNVTHGISTLINHTKKIEKGELDFHIDVEKNDEIGFLTVSFNKMTARLNQLINKTYRLELSENEAKLKALQAQISPHFLYNALDTINWSLIENGDYKTSSILGALSEILRYSIDDYKKHVTIREEVHQVSNYLKVQKSRFEHRFDYRIEVDEDVLEEKIPKLLLQPIVENAVVHGVENYKQGGMILIRGYAEGEDRIIVEISDNGGGIAPIKLLELNEMFHKIKQVTRYKETSHIGLINVYERIKLVYGESYNLSITNQEGMGTKVQLVLGRL